MKHTLITKALFFTAGLSAVSGLNSCQAIQETGSSIKESMKEGLGISDPKPPVIDKPKATSGSNPQQGPGQPLATVNGDLELEVLGSTDGFNRIQVEHRGSNDYRIFPDSMSFARVVPSGSRSRAQFNGQLGPEFSRVESFAASPDGSRWGYVAHSATQMQVIIDGETVQSFPREGYKIDILPTKRLFTSSTNAVNSMTQNIVAGERILFSPNGKHYAFTVSHQDPESKREVMQVFFDGVELYAASNVAMMAFTPASQLIFIPSTYSPEQGHATYFAIGSKMSPKIEGKIADVSIHQTSEGEKVAFRELGQNGSRPHRIYVDNQVALDMNQEPYAEIAARPSSSYKIHLADDLSSIGLVVKWTEERQSAAEFWVNGQKAGNLHMANSTTASFLGPNGRYAFHQADGRIVVDGKTHRDYERLMNVSFAKDGPAIYYTVSSAQGHFVVDESGKEIGPFKPATPQTMISADGKTRAFISGQKGRQELHVNGIKLGPTNTRDQAISGDWKYAYFAKDDPKYTIQASAKKAGVTAVFRQDWGNKARAMNASGTHMAEFKINRQKGSYTATFDFYINETFIEGGFKAMPFVLRFTEENTIQFLAERGTDLVRGTYKVN
jgi:hypothetical protein